MAISPNNPSFEPATGGQVIGDVIKNDTIDKYTYINYQYVLGPYIKGTGNNSDTFNSDGTIATTNNADGWTVNSADTTSIFAGTTPSAKGYIAFNALLQMNRPALTLINHVIYLGFASHGDDGPYYGWLLGYSATNLGNVSAFLTVPNFDNVKGSAGFTSVGGLWGAGATITYDGTYLYFAVGNGSFNPATSNFSSSYVSTDGTNTVQLPRDSDYGDSVLKVAIDPNATQANVNLKNAAAGNPTPDGSYNPDGGYNVNGYGLKVVDFFTPSNVWELNLNDEDIGSSGVLLIPTTGPGAMTAPDGDAMLVLAGKEGRIYLLDAGNLGGYNTQYITDGHQTAGAKNNTSDPTANPAPYDNILGEYYYAQAHGVIESKTGLVVVANNQTNHGYAIPSYFNGRFYLALGGTAEMGFNVSSFYFPTGVTKANRTAIYTSPAFTTPTTYGPRGSTAAISANGTSNAIIWNNNVNQNGSDDLLAYDTSANVLFNSNWTLPGGANNTLTNGVSGSTGIKFGIPTVFNGMVYVGTGGGSGSTGVRLGTITGYATFSVVNNVPVFASAPGIPPQPALATASDTGTSNSDRITNDTTPTFTGTATPNSTVSILIDGQSKGFADADGSGNYSVTTSPLGDGIHSVVAIATNVNGASPTSSSISFTLDTQPPHLDQLVILVYRLIAAVSDDLRQRHHAKRAGDGSESRERHHKHHDSIERIQPRAQFHRQERHLDIRQCRRQRLARWRVHRDRSREHDHRHRRQSSDAGCRPAVHLPQRRSQPRPGGQRAGFQCSGEPLRRIVGDVRDRRFQLRRNREHE